MELDIETLDGQGLGFRVIKSLSDRRTCLFELKFETTMQDVYAGHWTVVSFVLMIAATVPPRSRDNMVVSRPKPGTSKDSARSNVSPGL